MSPILLIFVKQINSLEVWPFQWPLIVRTFMKCMQKHYSKKYKIEKSLSQKNFN